MVQLKPASFSFIKKKKTKETTSTSQVSPTVASMKRRASSTINAFRKKKQQQNQDYNEMINSSGSSVDGFNLDFLDESFHEEDDDDHDEKHQEASAPSNTRNDADNAATGDTRRKQEEPKMPIISPFGATTKPSYYEESYGLEPPSLFLPQDGEKQEARRIGASERKKKSATTKPPKRRNSSSINKQRNVRGSSKDNDDDDDYEDDELRITKPPSSKAKKSKATSRESSMKPRRKKSTTMEPTRKKSPRVLPTKPKKQRQPKDKNADDAILSLDDYERPKMATMRKKKTKQLSISQEDDNEDGKRRVRKKKLSKEEEAAPPRRRKSAAANNKQRKSGAKKLSMEEDDENDDDSRNKRKLSSPKDKKKTRKKKIKGNKEKQQDSTIQKLAPPSDDEMSHASQHQKDDNKKKEQKDEAAHLEFDTINSPIPKLAPPSDAEMSHGSQYQKDDNKKKEPQDEAAHLEFDPTKSSSPLWILNNSYHGVNNYSQEESVMIFKDTTSESDRDFFLEENELLQSHSQQEQHNENDFFSGSSNGSILENDVNSPMLSEKDQAAPIRSPDAASDTIKGGSPVSTDPNLRPVEEGNQTGPAASIAVVESVQKEHRDVDTGVGLIEDTSFEGVPIKNAAPNDSDVNDEVMKKDLEQFEEGKMALPGDSSEAFEMDVAEASMHATAQEAHETDENECDRGMRVAPLSAPKNDSPPPMVLAVDAEDSGDQDDSSHGEAAEDKYETGENYDCVRSDRKGVESAVQKHDSDDSSVDLSISEALDDEYETDSSEERSADGSAPKKSKIISDTQFDDISESSHGNTDGKDEVVLNDRDSITSGNVNTTSVEQSLRSNGGTTPPGDSGSPDAERRQSNNVDQLIFMKRTLRKRSSIHSNANSSIADKVEEDTSGAQELAAAATRSSLENENLAVYGTGMEDDYGSGHVSNESAGSNLSQNGAQGPEAKPWHTSVPVDSSSDSSSYTSMTGTSYDEDIQMAATLVSREETGRPSIFEDPKNPPSVDFDSDYESYNSTSSNKVEFKSLDNSFARSVHGNSVNSTPREAQSSGEGDVGHLESCMLVDVAVHALQKVATDIDNDSSSSASCYSLHQSSGVEQLHETPGTKQAMLGKVSSRNVLEVDGEALIRTSGSGDGEQPETCRANDEQDQTLVPLGVAGAVDLDIVTKAADNFVPKDGAGTVGAALRNSSSSDAQSIVEQKEDGLCDAAKKGIGVKHIGTAHLSEDAAMSVDAIQPDDSVVDVARKSLQIQGSVEWLKASSYHSQSFLGELSESEPSSFNEFGSESSSSSDSSSDDESESTDSSSSAESGEIPTEIPDIPANAWLRISTLSVDGNSASDSESDQSNESESDRMESIQEDAPTSSPQRSGAVNDDQGATVDQESVIFGNEIPTFPEDHSRFLRSSEVPEDLSSGRESETSSTSSSSSSSSSSASAQIPTEIPDIPANEWPRISALSVDGDSCSDSYSDSDKGGLSHMEPIKEQAAINPSQDKEFISSETNRAMVEGDNNSAARDEADPLALDEGRHHDSIKPTEIVVELATPGAEELDQSLVEVACITIDDSKTGEYQPKVTVQVESEELDRSSVKETASVELAKVDTKLAAILDASTAEDSVAQQESEELDHPPLNAVTSDATSAQELDHSSIAVQEHLDSQSTVLPVDVELHHVINTHSEELERSYDEAVVIHQPSAAENPDEVESKHVLHLESLGLEGFAVAGMLISNSEPEPHSQPVVQLESAADEALSRDSERALDAVKVELKGAADLDGEELDPLPRSKAAEEDSTPAAGAEVVVKPAANLEADFVDFAVEKLDPDSGPPPVPKSVDDESPSSRSKGIDGVEGSPKSIPADFANTEDDGGKEGTLRYDEHFQKSGDKATSTVTDVSPVGHTTKSIEKAVAKVETKSTEPRESTMFDDLFFDELSAIEESLRQMDELLYSPEAKTQGQEEGEGRSSALHVSIPMDNFIEETRSEGENDDDYPRVSPNRGFARIDEFTEDDIKMTELTSDIPMTIRGVDDGGRVSALEFEGVPADVAVNAGSKPDPGYRKQFRGLSSEENEFFTLTHIASDEESKASSAPSMSRRKHEADLLKKRQGLFQVEHYKEALPLEDESSAIKMTQGTKEPKSELIAQNTAEVLKNDVSEASKAVDGTGESPKAGTESQTISEGQEAAADQHNLLLSQQNINYTKHETNYTILLEMLMMLHPESMQQEDMGQLLSSLQDGNGKIVKEVVTRAAKVEQRNHQKLEERSKDLKLQLLTIQERYDKEQMKTSLLEMNLAENDLHFSEERGKTEALQQKFDALSEEFDKLDEECIQKHAENAVLKEKLATAQLSSSADEKIKNEQTKKAKALEKRLAKIEAAHEKESAQLKEENAKLRELVRMQKQTIFKAMQN